MTEKNNSGSEDIYKDEFLNFSQIAKRFPAFTEGSLRWLRFNGDANGFNQCVRKVGRRCVISVQCFEKWLASKTTQGHR